MPETTGRLLDDDVQILLRYKGGARGMLWASQVAVGNENGLKLGIYGIEAPASWRKFVCGRKLWNYDNLEPAERKLVL